MYPISKTLQQLNQKSYTQMDRDKIYKDDWITTTFLSFVASVLVFARIGHTAAVYATDGQSLGMTGMTLDEIINDILAHPFALFPTSWKWLLLSTTVPLVVCISGYQEYIKKRNTMWVDAHGSGGFEKNYAGYYREYLYDPKLIGGPTMRNVENKEVSKKEDLIIGANLYDKILYEIKIKSPGAKNKLITKEDIEKCKLNAQVYSNEVYLSMNAYFTRRNLNALILGASGTGKSRFVVKPNLLQANSSYVVTDPSGENLASTAKFLEEKGYLIKVFNLKDMATSNKYNPFNYINDAKDIPALVTCMKNNIDSAGTGVKKDSGANKFWDDSTVALLCACVGYLYEAFTDENQYILDENGKPIPEVDEETGEILMMHDAEGNILIDRETGEEMPLYKVNPYWKGRRNFKNVNLIRMSYVDESQPDMVDDMDRLFADWEQEHPKSFAVNQYKTFKLASGKTTREILVSTAVLLGNYFDLDACTNLTYMDEMEIEELGKRKMALFIITPEGDPTFNWLAACLYSQIFTILYKQGEENSIKRGNDDVSLDVPVRLVLDEMANIGSIPQFNEKLATMRKYKISAMPIFQSRSQLNDCFKDASETLIENCDTLVFLGGAGEKTTKELSGKLGKETIKTFSYGGSYGKQNSNSENRQEIARDTLTPDEIARMRNDECIIWIRGIKPFCTKKFTYEKHPNYKFSSEGDKTGKHHYDISRFATVYSDDLIQAATIPSPSDEAYELYRDPMVLKQVAPDYKPSEDDEDAAGPIFVGKRYSFTDKKRFLSANNLNKQIEDKQKAAQMKMGLMGMSVPQAEPKKHKGQKVTVPEKTGENNLSERGEEGKTLSERERIEGILKNLDKDILLSPDTYFKYIDMTEEDIKERYTLEQNFCPDYEFYEGDYPSSDVVYGEEKKNRKSEGGLDIDDLDEDEIDELFEENFGENSDDVEIDAYHNIIKIGKKPKPIENNSSEEDDPFEGTENTGEEYTADYSDGGDSYEDGNSSDFIEEAPDMVSEDDFPFGLDDEE